jgi:hypothetical protein
MGGHGVSQSPRIPRVLGEGILFAGIKASQPMILTDNESVWRSSQLADERRLSCGDLAAHEV